MSVHDSLSHAYVRSIAHHEPRRLPACLVVHLLLSGSGSYTEAQLNGSHLLIVCLKLRDSLLLLYADFLHQDIVDIVSHLYVC